MKNIITIITTLAIILTTPVNVSAQTVNNTDFNSRENAEKARNKAEINKNDYTPGSFSGVYFIQRYVAKRIAGICLR